MSTQQVEILFICGSPRSHSSEALLALVEQGVRDTGARSRKFLLSKKRIAYCRGCGSCEKTGACILASEGSSNKIEDDYLELMEALAYADAVAVIAPVYFAGPPAQLKALYDRMQPFWARSYSLGQKAPPKRPAQIFVLGGGGDNHGFEPLVTISKSALAVAGFSLEKVQNFIGFKCPKEVTPPPANEQAAELPFKELARLRKETALQWEFQQRAVAAGSAFARFVAKQRLGAEGRAEQAAWAARASGAAAAEQADAAHDAPVAELSLFELLEDSTLGSLGKSSGEHEAPSKIIDRTDFGFEALKQAARASKSSQFKSPELDAVMVEAVASLSEQDGVAASELGSELIEELDSGSLPDSASFPDSEPSPNTDKDE